jgi:hypothetical protein
LPNDNPPTLRNAVGGLFFSDIDQAAIAIAAGRSGPSLGDTAFERSRFVCDCGVLAVEAVITEKALAPD